LDFALLSDRLHHFPGGVHHFLADAIARYQGNLELLHTSSSDHKKISLTEISEVTERAMLDLAMDIAKSKLF
jgi:hypothetical protein